MSEPKNAAAFLKENTLVILAALVLSRGAGAVEFAYGFEGPSEIRGEPGQEVTFDVFSTLTTSSNETGDGVLGWSVSLAVEGADVVEVSVAGIQVSTVYHEETGQPPIDPYLMDLADSYYATAGIAVGFMIDPLPDGVQGAVAAVVLNPVPLQFLQPEGTQRILRVRLKTTVPADVATGAVILRYEDGLRGPGDPYLDEVTYQGNSMSPLLESRTIPLVPEPIRFIRGDANADGTVDISDAIRIFQALFSGGAVLGCRTAADASADGKVDLTDGVHVLGFKFLHEGSMSPPYPACGAGSGVDPAECPPGSSGCSP
jgi:hypothetical protein